jgi:hypothetical protein
MSNYTQSTNFATKDALSSGDPLKIVKGTEINTEFVNIAVAIATKADLVSPTFTGSPILPIGTTGTTQSAGNNSTALATTAYSDAAITAERTSTATLTNKTLTSPSISSPTLTGTPVAPTASVDTNTTQVATTAFVVAQIADDAPTKSGSGASGTWAIDISGNAASATKLSTASGSAPSYSARAWVNFNGTGTVAIRASANISSITDNGTGDYTLNFSTAMSDANYCVTGTAKSQANTTITSNNNTLMVLPAIYAASNIEFFTARDGINGAIDAENVNVAIFR